MARACAGRRGYSPERTRTRCRDDEIARLKSKVGEITMDNELLYAKIEALGDKRPLAHMYGPAVRRKRVSSICRLFGLASCIRPLIGAVLRATMDISARAFSLGGRPRMGHVGHQFSQAPGRPSSISFHPLADLGR